MRIEIKRLQRRIGVTSIYVTHDQTEAMTLADRLAVINDGRIEQMGAPIELYNNPKTLFVASFIGAPHINLIPARFENKKLVCGNLKLPGFKNLPEDIELVLGIRPDFLKPDTKGQLEIQVDLVEQHGADNLVYGALKNSSNDTELCFKTTQNTLPDIDSNLKLKFEQKHAMVFNKSTGERLI